MPLNKSTVFIIISLVLVSCISMGPSDPFKWGNVTDHAVQKQFSNHDSSAAAEILFDIGKIQVIKVGFSYVLERHVRVQIFNESGKKYTNIRIPYYYDEVVNSIKATTYLTDGTQIKLNRSDIFEEGEKKGWREKVFAMPGVESNCIIEYKYRLSSKHLPWLNTWHFQSDLFTQYSKLRLSIPAGFKYLTYMKNPPIAGYRPAFEKVLLPDQKKNSIYTWEFRDLDPFIEEPYMTTRNDYIASVDFQLVSYTDAYNFIPFANTWDKFSKRNLEFYGSYTKPDRSTVKLAERITTSVRNTNNKISILYNFVRDSIVTTEYEGYSNDKIRSGGKVIKSKSGSRVEKNLLLLGLIRAVGIDADPMLISTRSHGVFKESYPRFKSFNHLIVRAESGGKHFLLDTKDKYYPLSLLPASDISYRGFVFNKYNNYFIDIPAPNTVSKKYAQTTSSLDSEGNLVAETVYIYDGYRNSYVRRTLSKYDDEKDFIEKYILDEIENVEIDSFNISYGNSISALLTVRVNYHINGFGEVAGDFIYFKPSFIFHRSENIFKLDDRKYPVDYNYPRMNEEMTTFKLPDSYEIVEYPERMKLDISGHSYTQIVKVTSNTLKYHKQEYVKNVLFSPRLYKDIKTFYRDVVIANQIHCVIKKK